MIAEEVPATMDTSPFSSPPHANSETCASIPPTATTGRPGCRVRLRPRATRARDATDLDDAVGQLVGQVIDTERGIQLDGQPPGDRVVVVLADGVHLEPTHWPVSRKVT